VFQRFSDESLSELESACATHLADLLSERVEPQFTLPLGEIGVEDTNLAEFISFEQLSELPPRYRQGVEQAVSLFRHLERKTGVSFAPPFTALLGALDEAARGLMIDLLGSDIPQEADNVAAFFEPDLVKVPVEERKSVEWNARNLRMTIVDRKGTMPI